MPFSEHWTKVARAKYEELREKAEQSLRNRRKPSKKRQKTKSTKSEGLFEQIHKTLRLLLENPKHPGLNTHEYSRIENPYDSKQKVWEAYAQNRTPSAYRIFWCYGPGKGEITIIDITPHS
ncbi:MAG: hypothetical protein WD069_15965 [Planctomycetales bacterium]